MSKTVAQNGHCPSFTSYSQDNEETLGSDEVILVVSKEIVSLSLGFAIDCGNSTTKLVYRSKEDYELGKPKDADSPYGKLRLRYVCNEDVNELIEFLRVNCDIIYTSRRKDDKEAETSITWCQIGISYQSWKTQLETSFNIRTQIHNETDIQVKGLQTFYTNANSLGIYQRPRPPSTNIINGALKQTIAKMQTFEAFKKLGEKSFGEMMSKPRDGFDLEEFKVKLMTADGVKFASEMGLTEIEYPCVLVGMGSTMVVYILQENQTMRALDYFPTAGKSFVNLGRALTGAKDFYELSAMASRGKAHRVDTMSGDQTDRTPTGDDWYNVWTGETVVCSLGKLGDDRFKGSYSTDDIAASLALSFCMTASKSVAMHARQENIKSVVFFGSFLSQPPIREMLEACMAAESLMIPFIGGDLVKMAVLPNPGFVGALGTWQINWEQEQNSKRENDQ